MKKILSLLSICIITLLAKSQNTFPSSGNVGIGTASPSALLHIKDSIARVTIESAKSSGTAGLNLKTIGSTWLLSNNYHVPNMFEIQDGNNNTALAISPARNILIGTTSDIASALLIINSNTQGV